MVISGACEAPQGGGGVLTPSLHILYISGDSDFVGPLLYFQLGGNVKTENPRYFPVIGENGRFKVENSLYFSKMAE